ncbi:hypothetical protein AAMO2058_001383300 [Amorphochlora amoebiformis]
MSPNERIPDNFVTKLDVAGSDYTLALEATGLGDSVQISYLQKLLPGFSLGAQYVFVPSYLMTPVNVAAHYKWKGTILTLSATRMGPKQYQVSTNYARKVDKNFTVAAELNMGQRMSSSVGVKYDFKNETKSRYQASFDSELTSSVAYSEELIPGVRVGYCGSIAHSKNEAMFGMQFSTGEA